MWDTWCYDVLHPTGFPLPHRGIYGGDIWVSESTSTYTAEAETEDE
jgi:hypothetical protein